MSFPHKIYLLGDSHATEIHSSGFLKDHNIHWKTLGGYSITCYKNPKSLRDMPDTFVAGFDNTFASLEKNSIVLISYTDVDARISMGEKSSYEEIFPLFRRCIQNIFEIAQPKYLLFLDFYSIATHIVGEQTCSPQARVKNRNMVIKVIKELKETYPVDILSTADQPSLFDDENGFVKNALYLRDAIHYDLSLILLENEKCILKQCEDLTIEKLRLICEDL